MRIKGLQLAGLAVALVGGGAKVPTADTPLTAGTMRPWATSSAGNITINGGAGAIAVTAGQAATTADGAGLNITNNSTLSSNKADNSTSILLVNGGSGTITTGGSI